MKYKIWSIEHNQWWGSDSCGYTGKLELTGIYEEKEAKEICRQVNQHDAINECMIPVKSLGVEK